MKISQYGYKEETIKKHYMTMGDIKIAIAQGMIRQGLKDIKVRIVHVGWGEVDEYNGLDELMLHDFNNGYELICFGASLIHMNTTDEDIIVVRINETDIDEE